MTAIGIGIGGEVEKVQRSIEKVSISSDIVCYSKEECLLEGRDSAAFRISDDPSRSLVDDLVSGRIDAAVRGSLPANETLSILKAVMGVDHLERAALLETADGRKFFLAPVGIDEGWSVAEKILLAEKIKKIASGFGISEKIAVLSGGRFGDIGRHPVVDRTMADAELVACLTGGRHYEILIEDAISDCGIVLAPDGISGNLIFRTLTFLGSGHGHGAPVLNIDYIFVDTSRASPDYTNAIRLAESLLMSV